MTNAAIQMGRRNALQIVYQQFLLLALCAVVAALVAGGHAGVAVLTGSLACWVPTLLFVQLAFINQSSAKTFIVLFTLGEVLRLIVAAVLLMCVLRMLALDARFVIGGFMVALASFWIAAGVYGLKRKAVQL